MISDEESRNTRYIAANHTLTPSSQAASTGADRTASPGPTPSHGNFYISGSANVHVGDSYLSQSNHSGQDFQRALLQSLVYPQMHSRYDQVSTAQFDTYRWMLQPLPQDFRVWDCFDTCFINHHSQKHLYWIHGKPGSGKSTIMKFLYVNAFSKSPDQVLKLQHFFWSPGTRLQKSLEGLYRSFLSQILHQRFEAVRHIASFAEHADPLGVEKLWTIHKLRHTLLEAVKALSHITNVVLIIDGLDECDDHGYQHDELVDLLFEMSELDKVRVCASSRPWNAFRDAFDGKPQLKLEDLTKADISTYATSRLQKDRLWNRLQIGNPSVAHEIVQQVLSRAEGVFLWVVLVIRDLLHDLRDGDDLYQLRQKLQNVPSDLDEYFDRIVASIEIRHRREASRLLQLSLYEETAFVTAFSLLLVDTIFISEQSDEFALREGLVVPALDLRDYKAFYLVLESTWRKLNSRCKGLLECVVPNEDDQRDKRSDISFLDGAIHKTDDMAVLLAEAFTVQISLIHRSLRDFLLLPRMQALLFDYNDGQQFDAGLFLCNSRILQLIAHASANYLTDHGVGLASHIMTALWVHRYSARSAELAAIVKTAIEKIAWTACYESFWYIEKPFSCWAGEQSNFLSLAIDFRLTSYVLENLTTADIHQKRGRPLLDYILRPRFVAHYDHVLEDGFTSLAFVNAALDRGADPNELLGPSGPSVWALYLCFLADMINLLGYGSPQAQTHCTDTIAALVEAGASKLLPLQWLSSVTCFEDNVTSAEDEGGWWFPLRRELDNPAHFFERWPNASPRTYGHGEWSQEPYFAVSDLLNHLLKPSDDHARILICRLRESEALTSLSQYEVNHDEMISSWHHIRDQYTAASRSTTRAVAMRTSADLIS